MVIFRHPGPRPLLEEFHNTTSTSLFLPFFHSTKNSAFSVVPQASFPPFESSRSPKGRMRVVRACDFFCITPLAVPSPSSSLNSDFWSGLLARLPLHPFSPTPPSLFFSIHDLLVSVVLPIPPSPPLLACDRQLNVPMALFALKARPPTPFSYHPPHGSLSLLRAALFSPLSNSHGSHSRPVHCTS